LNASRRGRNLEDLAKNGPAKEEAALAIKFAEHDATATKARDDRISGRLNLESLLIETTPADPSTQEECNEFNIALKELKLQLDYAHAWQSLSGKLSLEYSHLNLQAVKPIPMKN